MATGARGLALAFLRSAAERGIGVNEAIRQLQAGGVPTYRRADMLRDYRQFLGIPERADALHYVRRDYRPSQRLYTETTGFLKRRYHYQTDIRVRVRSTGREFTLSNLTASDSQLTRGLAEETSVDAVKYSLDISDMEIVDYHLEVAMWNTDKGWLS